MYRNAYQGKLVSIFFSAGSNPLEIWETHKQNGYISRFIDPDLRSMVLEIGSTNVSTTYMICPKGKTVLGITMPFLIMIVKNLKKYFTFEVTILDDTGTRRRFRVSNFQSSTSIQPLCTAMPIGLSDGWNQIQFNLSEFTQRAYKKQFVEVQKVKINANIRLRRIYFCANLIPEDQLPPEYKLYFPIGGKSAKGTPKEQKTQQSQVSTTKQTSLEHIKSSSKIKIVKPPPSFTDTKHVSLDVMHKEEQKLKEITGDKREDIIEKKDQDTIEGVQIEKSEELTAETQDKPITENYDEQTNERGEEQITKSDTQETTEQTEEQTNNKNEEEITEKHEEQISATNKEVTEIQEEHVTKNKSQLVIENNLSQTKVQNKTSPPPEAVTETEGNKETANVEPE